MSLFDQFFSNINKNFMYDMVDKVISKNHNIDIKSDDKNFDIMCGKMQEVFDKNNFEDITDINQLLLDTMINEFTNKYSNDKQDFNNKLEMLIQEREKNIIDVKETNNVEEKVENKNPIPQGNSTSIEDIFKKNESNVIPERSNDEEKNEIKTPIKINSSKRVNIQSSRYNYIIDLKKEKIKSEDLVEISKLIIPIENNYLFNIPLLLLTIKELDLEIYLQQEKLITNKNGTTGIYEPIEDHKIKTKNIDRITVDIRDMTGEKYRYNDIIKINIIEVKDNILILTCSNISKNNYKINDMIKILNINTFEIDLLEILSKPLKISAVNSNMIFCSFEGDKQNKIYNNIDMRIINMSNQNLLIFK